MKKSLRILLCLGLGTVTTTLDARFAHERGMRITPVPVAADDSHLPFPRQFIDANDATWTLDVEVREGFGIRAEGYAYLVKADDTKHTVALAGRARFGWPFRSMRSDGNVAPELLDADIESLRTLTTEQIWWGLDDYPADGVVRSPVLLHFPGFIINTLLYGAIWFGVLFGLARAKRLIRAQRRPPNRLEIHTAPSGPDMPVNLSHDRFEVRFELTREDVFASGTTDEWRKQYQSMECVWWVCAVALGGVALSFLYNFGLGMGILIALIGLFVFYALRYRWKWQALARRRLQKWIHENPDHLGEVRVSLDSGGMRYISSKRDIGLAWSTIRNVWCTPEHVFLGIGDGAFVLARRGCADDAQFARLIACINEWRTADARIESCPACGYVLKGQRAAGCPECGWNRATNFTTGDADGTEKRSG